MATQSFEPIHFADFKAKIEDKNRLLGALFLFFLFFCTFLFVYFLYVCTHRRASASNSDNFTTNQNGSAEYYYTRTSMGLDPAAINRLPIFSYGSGVNISMTSQQGECSICLSVFQEGDKVKVLPLCHHGFHSECVDKWLKARSSCPLCRASILLPHESSVIDSEIP